MSDSPPKTPRLHQTRAAEVFRIEAAAIIGLIERLDQQFDAVIETILASRGRVIICGMGKSGIIGKKIAATLASTGTPAFFMHPAEAYHGDLGMVEPQDVFVAISYSGETEELLRLLPFLRDNGNRIIVMTGQRRSTLAQKADFHLLVRVEQEACPLQLAPTASTTATLAMGDALAVALMHAREFQPHHFARFHPGGSLGRRLLHRVRDEMRGQPLPLVSPQATADVVLDTMTSGRLGLAIITADGQYPLGIITDGDLRRAVQHNQQNFFALTASAMMSPNPLCIGPDAHMSSAIELMSQHQITALIVVDEQAIVGVVQK